MGAESSPDYADRTPSPRTFETSSRLGKRVRASPVDSPAAQIYRNIKSATRRSASAGYRQSPLAQSSPHESPSRFLVELSKQHLDYQRELSARLDDVSKAQAEDHNSALAAAAAEHDRVRLEAERAQRRAALRRERERIELEEEEQQDLYRQQQETVEREIAFQKRGIEEQRRLAEKKKAAAEMHAQAEAEKQAAAHRIKEAQERAARAAAENLEQERKNKASTSSAARHDTPKYTATSVVQPVPGSASDVKASASNGTVSNREEVHSGVVTSIAQRDAIHARYLAMHKQLKHLRKFVVDQSKSNTQMKKRLGEMRREVRKSVGQLTAEKGANRQPINAIRNILLEASRTTEPSTDVRPYILDIPDTASSTSPQVPALMLYILNILSKAIISQFIDEASVAPKAADPAGVLAISIFAAAEFRWSGLSLIDMLLAKFHVVCPVLFGVYGSETTERGRARLGWRREEGGGWIGEQKHGERMTGLGAGFGAVSLRDFRNSKNTNPYPCDKYWQALARITNTPPEEVTETHYIVLKAMVETHADKVMGFFGPAYGAAAIRRAVVEFPRQALKGSVAAGALRTLQTTLHKELGIAL